MGCFLQPAGRASEELPGPAPAAGTFCAAVVPPVAEVPSAGVAANVEILQPRGAQQLPGESLQGGTRAAAGAEATGLEAESGSLAEQRILGDQLAARHGLQSGAAHRGDLLSGGHIDATGTSVAAGCGG